MNNYSHDSPPKKVQTKSSGTEESLTPPPNEIIQHVGVNLVVDAVDNNYSLLLRPRWQTVCRMSISVCPLAMWSTDKHSTVTLSEGTAVFIGGQQWAAGAACRHEDGEEAANLHTSFSPASERDNKLCF